MHGVVISHVVEADDINCVTLIGKGGKELSIDITQVDGGPNIQGMRRNDVGIISDNRCAVLQETGNLVYKDLDSAVGQNFVLNLRTTGQGTQQGAFCVIVGGFCVNCGKEAGDPNTGRLGRSFRRGLRRGLRRGFRGRIRGRIRGRDSGGCRRCLRRGFGGSRSEAAAHDDG
jgi:hypothetical protein